MDTRQLSRSSNDGLAECTQANNDVSDVNKGEPNGIPSLPQLQRSELLCYLSNKVRCNISKSVLVARLASFYTGEEISTAKNMLFQDAESVKRNFPDAVNFNIPKLTKRANEIKNCEDLYELYKKLVDTSCPVPMYCAVDLNRIPSDISNNCEFGELTNICSAMQQQVKRIYEHITYQDYPPLSQPTDNIGKMSNYNKSHLINNACDGKDVVYPSAESSLEKSDALTKEDAPNSNNEQLQRSYANTLVNSQALLDGANLSARSDPRQGLVIPRGRLVVSGTRSRDTCKIKTASKKCSVFAGNFNIDTEESEISEFLEDRGISDVRVKKLPGERNGYTFKTAAFVVTFDSKYIPIIYNEDTWPEDSNVREWINKPSSIKKQKDDLNNDG